MEDLVCMLSYVRVIQLNFYYYFVAFVLSKI